MRGALVFEEFSRNRGALFVVKVTEQRAGNKGTDTHMLHKYRTLRSYSQLTHEDLYLRV